MKDGKTNLQYIATRKFANLEWETFKDKMDAAFVAICHKTSTTVYSSSWDGIWEEIIKASKELLKKKRNGYG